MSEASVATEHATLPQIGDCGPDFALPQPHEVMLVTAGRCFILGTTLRQG